MISQSTSIDYHTVLRLNSWTKEIPDRKPARNLKSEISQDCAQKPQRNCTFMNSASEYVTVDCTIYTAY